MVITALDTHEVVKELKAVGFTDEQAEAVTRVVRRSQDIDLSNLATKADLEKSIFGVKGDLEKSIAGVKGDLEKSIAGVKGDLEKSIAATQVTIAESKTEILKWMVSTIGIQTVVIIGALVTLMRMSH